MRCDICNMSLSYGFRPDNGKTYCRTCHTAYWKEQDREKFLYWCNRIFRRGKQKEIGPVDSRFEILDL